MGKPYSVDLRERVVAAVETGGMSCPRAALQFGVDVSTAINWVRRVSSVRPGALRRARWADTSRSQFRASTVPGCRIGRRRRTSPCARLWPNLPIAASRLIHHPLVSGPPSRGPPLRR
jgi:transposase-like protein